jgi:predicted RNA binding protein with dsRBD fold (UPF0201 family)
MENNRCPTNQKIAQNKHRVSSHATEDPEKVQTAVRNLLPGKTLQMWLFEKNSLTGIMATQLSCLAPPYRIRISLVRLWNVIRFKIIVS